MKRWLKLAFAGAFPWLVLLLNDNPLGALLALVMQASVIGWIPASMWAFRVLQEKDSHTKHHEKGE
jgi:hypothetical protein